MDSHAAEVSPRAGGSQWAATPERGSDFLLKAGVRIAMRLGRPVTMRLLHLVAAYYFLFAPGAARAARGYLQRVLGRPARARDRYRQVYYFAVTILDRVYLLKGRHDLFEISVEGIPLMLETLSRGKGAFLLGSHLGSFALVSFVGQRRADMQVAMAMYEAQAGPLSNFLRQGEEVPEVIPLGQLEAMLRIRDRLEEGKFVGMLADRTIMEAPAQIESFLGRTALFPSGPMRVAAALRRPVIFMTGLYRGGNRYHVVFHQIADFSQPIVGGRDAAVHVAISNYAQLLERYTRSDPYNWFNFYDFWHGAPASGTPEPTP
jgi:predicted LPLAT superfamily acyltransferase